MSQSHMDSISCARLRAPARVRAERARADFWALTSRWSETTNNNLRVHLTGGRGLQLGEDAMTSACCDRRSISVALMVFGVQLAFATVSAAQSITEFPTVTANSQPYDITVGADGNLWFTENGASKIGRISLAGTVT